MRILLHLLQPVEVIFPSIQIYREKKQETMRNIKFYSKFIKKGNLCFDIGAHIGEQTEIFLKLGAKVVAIEPQIEDIKAMQIKFKKNKI